MGVRSISLGGKIGGNNNADDWYDGEMAELFLINRDIGDGAQEGLVRSLSAKYAIPLN